MKLDRNLNKDGLGKYALVKIRDLENDPGEYSEDTAFGKAVAYRFPAEVIDWGNTLDTEFFVIRLRDIFAQKALYAYATAIDEFIDRQGAGFDASGWVEYSNEIREMARRSGGRHPYFKLPD